MNKKLRKILINSSVINLPLLALIVTSCSNSTENNFVDKKISKNYDFGLATEPINNLNYIRYKSLDKVLPALIDPFAKSGPSANLKSIINVNDFNMVMIDTSNTKDEKGNDSNNFNDFFKLKSELETNDGYGRVTGSFLRLADIGFVGGLGKSSIGDLRRNASIYAFRSPKNSNNYFAFTGFVNNKQNLWSNGDIISAQDLRDYLEYILDLNTGSQRLDQVRKYGIRSTERFINAQKDYLQKFNKIYQNPWGRRKYILNERNEYIQDPNQEVWTSQTKDKQGNPLDTKEVEEIKAAALDFGFYTGQLFLDYSNEIINANLKYNPSFKLALRNESQKFKILVNENAKDEKDKFQDITLVPNVFVNPYQEFSQTQDNIFAKYKQLAESENSFSLIFDENKTPSIIYLIASIYTNLYPANRKYIETVAGGIDKFGSEPKKFLTSGAFKINQDEIILGPQGQIVLEKNKDYYDSKNTISNKIKIYFSTDRNTNATFFEDGYISQTYIPASKINKYWSSEEYKNYLNKNQGYGTIAYGFNLDNETNANSYIQDQDLRNAIYYSINREDAIKYVGWDFSFPVNTWTSYGQYRTFDGKNIETYFGDLSSNAKNNKEFQLQNYDFLVHLSKGYTFEKTIRGDFAFDKETAQYYLERFKSKHPNLKQVHLTFLNNSSDEQKKAGLFLKESVLKVLGSYVNIELKSLPENTFASFIEEGKYDIIYQNYDKLGGSGAHDYVSVFFANDEIDSLLQKNIAFKENPVGSYTYGEYIANLLLDQIDSKSSNQEKIQNILNSYLLNIDNKLKSIDELNSEYTLLKNKENLSNLEISSFASKSSLLLSDAFAKELNENEVKIYNAFFIKSALEYFLINNNNIKISRLKKMYINYITNFFTVDQIANITKDTKQRLKFNQSITKENYVSLDFWNKFIELSLQLNTENRNNYSDRISAFFSGNFTEAEFKEGWTQELVYLFIGELEKIIRDGAFVVPLMEVDTNWEITKVAGVDSLYTFALQYAYDFTNPPLAGLPRKRV
ncbi:ABC transporter substrate-binding protein [Mesomycoplasma molare]|uniref:ABC transporter substrate-binding protein n=1 Tax=Mesomycoplasma molare TaxID=171288 RepID=A0ABY5TW15_9BACT|nr:ABC transporter substrate-binding protein [Mesomycoplasma molare]UWD34529.1 ABC transporter substrate-binding protein [Mesomycoplasma molare]